MPWTYVIATGGPQRAAYLLTRLKQRAFQRGVRYAGVATTPYVNTIPVDQQPEYPGDRDIERRIKSIIRWNAMAMVVRANQQSHGHRRPHLDLRLGRHALRSGLQPLLPRQGRPRSRPTRCSSRATPRRASTPGRFCLGRLTEEHLKNFRRELQPTPGLSSYPHPWLMPDFWEFPTVSMGLGPIMAIYQARFNHYLVDRGIKPDAAASRVWAFLGDGECDEPETLGAITLAAREQLDNLIFVINCNLQRLDGPVRGNGKIIQELEGRLPRRRLERHQGDLGLRLGPAAGQGHRRPAGAPHGRGGRRRSIRSTSSARATTSASTSSASIRGWRRWWPT